MLTLTPHAKAVATFSLGILLVMGSLNRIGIAVAQVLNEIHSGFSPKTLTTVVALVGVAIGLALLVLSNQVVTRLDEGWARSLAQAAVVLAVIGTGIALLDVIAALAGDGYRPGGYYFGAVG